MVGTMEDRSFQESVDSFVPQSSSASRVSSGPYSEIPVRRYVTTFEPTYYENMVNAFNIPKRVFAWLYSISLAFFLVLALLFAAVTPIDVIAQTGGTSMSGLKMFIVIIVCVVFVVTCLIGYFVRLLQFRTALNDVPSKSVYIPLDGDYTQSVVTMIDSRIQQCVEIAKKAGPLTDDSVIINHPGLSPPDYLQRRNLAVLEQQGRSPHDIATTTPSMLLPSEASYEDIIRSVGDKFVTQRYRVLAPVDLPSHYSFREIVIYLAELYVTTPGAVRLPRIIELYEKFRFGPELISDRELVEFIIEFDTLANLCQSDYRQIITSDEQARADDLDRLDPGHHSRQDFVPADSSDELPGRDNRYNQSHFAVFTDDESAASVHLAPPRSGSVRSASIRRFMRHNNSSSSMKSVIRSRLALRGDPGGDSDDASMHRKYSGYVTDSENSDDSAADIYRWRRRPLSSGGA
ncbi:hypothetical protein DICA3_B12904 [Diutina catenulata]